MNWSDLKPGWYVELVGDRTDVEDWPYTVNPSFDPIAIEAPEGKTVLTA